MGKDDLDHAFTHENVRPEGKHPCDQGVVALTTKQKAELRELCKENDSHPNEWWCPTCARWVPGTQVNYNETHDICCRGVSADCEAFVNFARTAVPALLDENEKLRGELAEANGRANRFQMLVIERDKQLDRAKEDAQTERMRLAGCGVVAGQNTPKSAADRLDKNDPYWSSSYGDVCAAVDREMALRADLKDFEKFIDDVQAATGLHREWEYRDQVIRDVKQLVADLATAKALCEGCSGKAMVERIDSLTAQLAHKETVEQEREILVKRTLQSIGRPTEGLTIFLLVQEFVAALKIGEAVKAWRALPSKTYQKPVEMYDTLDACLEGRLPDEPRDK